MRCEAHDHQYGSRFRTILYHLRLFCIVQSFVPALCTAEAAPKGLYRVLEGVISTINAGVQLSRLTQKCPSQWID